MLEGHLRIRRLWIYDRRGDSSFAAWRKLCRELIAQNYDEVIDLHGSLRTRAAKVLFWWSARRFPRWRRISAAPEALGVFSFQVALAASLATGLLSRPFRTYGVPSRVDPGTDLGHLVRPGRAAELRAALALGDGPYYGLMPSSRWKGKKWSWEKYLEVARGIDATPVILGTVDDAESVQLASAMREAGLSTLFRPRREWRADSDLASLLAGAEFYLGMTPGSRICARHWGVRPDVAFGPTSPEMGFGPWRAASRSLQAPYLAIPVAKMDESARAFGPPIAA